MIGKALFAECPLSGTRHRLCQQPRGHSAKKNDRHGAGSVDGHFVECQPYKHLAKIFYFFKKNSLPSVSIRPSAKMFYFFSKFFLPSAPWPALGKVWIFFLKKIFVECPLAGTRQSLKFFLKKILCRVPWSWHSVKLEKWFSERPFFQLCRVLWPCVHPKFCTFWNRRKLVN